MKKIAAASIVIALSLACAIPAHAAGVVATTNLSVTLPVFPGSGSVSSLSGSVTGVGTGQPSGAIRLLTGDSISYQEVTCATGTASGTFHIGADQFALTWQRLGATALVRLEGAANKRILAAAVFTFPAGKASACLSGGETAVTASIVALGIVAPPVGTASSLEPIEE
jgi:hypothetical protein